ncbi:uncharacterized protein [Oryza sativa Japonica Group]|uniref:Os09g0300800 protein n=2 Tax=Oryza sativa subsp. japonica TaxID=39947 RepID=Q0J2T4_ORYSJ|nr:uncharacterized protein LOC4346665 [Oryza sativa Japonica Group]KAB8110008.1 hypothetical protein EE612_046758 [Oryza sativa]KAF2915537.1 hypothetical protein DAI22_09g042300 [Oryza sativa Japonica Group]BAF24731.1 Os09g0300800 [Oryza sativa Japonica Group]BAG88719.1 unnamed protein product [Oryza sativa Japonica Group]BAT07340.1 Os09g0300800 [Oryza sativa Japonica Group]|eukprot:NP_001062817.1 Os09g0300800 [Oryza sativa Japonica Group]
MKYSSGNDKMTIDIESLVKDVTICWQRAEGAKSRSGCKIPSLDQRDRPAAMCIGPNHHNPFYRQMEEEKKAMLYSILTQVDEQHKAAVLTRLMDAIKALENEARDHYLDRAESMSSSEFVQMLVIDGCYILGKFVLPHSCCPSTSDDGAQNGSAMQNMELVRDVFYRLDNQIPFCVLDEIHKVLHGKIIRSCTAVADVLVTHVGDLLENLSYSRVHALDVHASPWHLLHLLHTRLQPTAEWGSEKPTKGAAAHVVVSCASTPGFYRWRPATQYDAAGVRFRKFDGSSCILDVKLDGATLRVPSLVVDTNTYALLRNLMMLEQHNPDQLGSHVTAYCVFLSQLAGTPGDVALLARKGIIVHLLPSDSDVAVMFAGLCVGITIGMDEPKHNYLHKERNDLERIYNSRLMVQHTRNCVTLPHRNPMLVVALLAATLGLVCLLLQAIYTMKSYYCKGHTS